MLRVDTLQDLFMAAETLARFGANRDKSLTLMTNGGGAGVMAADAAALAGVPLSDLSDVIRATWTQRGQGTRRMVGFVLRGSFSTCSQRGPLRPCPFAQVR